MNFDDNKELFIEEARELLAKMEAALLSLEKEPGNGELINEVFRALHTIKGSGAMFGFDGMSAFAHGFENMFDDMRKGSVGVSSDIIGLSLRSLDCLSAWLDDGEAHESQASIERELEAIKATLRSGSTSAAAEPAVEPTAGRGGADDDSDGLTNLYRIRFSPSRDLLTRGVKVENLFGDLAELGQYYSYADVDDVPGLDGIDPTGLYLSWIIDLSTRPGSRACRASARYWPTAARWPRKTLTTSTDARSSSGSWRWRRARYRSPSASRARSRRASACARRS